MRRPLLFFWFGLCGMVVVSPSTCAQMWRGVDVSFLPEMEADGVVYQDQVGQDIAAPRAWMAGQGVNLVRLRVWHNPSEGLRSSWLEVLQEAERWDSLGVGLLIDYHFSDSWADPEHQVPPRAWSGMTFEALQSAMVCHIECTMKSLQVRGIEPVMVQLGNEINPGMMLPHGGIEDGFEPLSELLAAGHQAVEDVFPNCQVAVHVANLEAAPWFFGMLADEGYTPDVLAVSQYSKWHLQDVEAIADHVNDLHGALGRPVFLAETAYAWTAEWSDWTDNLWWTGDETLGYPFTPSGQLAYMEALDSALGSLGGAVCSGWCYWAPDWVASKGPTSTAGSSWENAALFDFDWTALPAWAVFGAP